MMLLLLKYSVIVSLATGKLQESYGLQRVTVLDLIEELDKRYRGFGDIFIPSPYGITNMRTSIFLRRPGRAALPVLDPKFELKDGDDLLMW